MYTRTDHHCPPGSVVQRMKALLMFYASQVMLHKGRQLDWGTLWCSTYVCQHMSIEIICSNLFLELVSDEEEGDDPSNCNDESQHEAAQSKCGN